MADKRRGKGPRAPSAAQQPLLEVLLANPEDRAQWSVLGDLLQTEGDPRGALMSLMLEREARPSAALLDAERRHRQQHLARLLPAIEEDPAEVVWWRGFPRRLRVTSIETLESIARDPAFRFLDTVALELETAAWADWLEALEGLEGGPFGWRRLRIDLLDCDEEIAPAPLLEALPGLEVLRIAYPDDGGQVDATGARAEHLRLLALRNVEHIELLDAHLPALTELRLLGDAQPGDGLRELPLWRQLARVVIDVGEHGDPPPPAADTGPTILHTAIRDRDYWFTTAFVVVAQRIEPALLGELAARISGLEHLQAAIGHSPWHQQPMTAFRLHGAGTSNLLPYGLARALEHRLAPPPPIALFTFSDAAGVADAATLGPRPAYHREGKAPEALVRDVLDAAFGCDPGPDALELLLEELDCAEPQMLLGTPGVPLELFTEIHPDAIPAAPEYDEFGDHVPVWHERDLRSDHYLDEIIDEPPAVTATEHASPGAPLGAPPADLDLAADEPGDDADEPVDHLVADAPVDPEPGARETADGRDAWARVDELGIEQEGDPDADSAPVRWPDPELAYTDVVDATSLPDLARCTRCEQPGSLRACSGCGARHCTVCAVEDEHGIVICAGCIAEAESPPEPPPQSPPPDSPAG